MKKVNAGALQYVIFISIIIMLMIMLLLQFFSHQTNLQKKNFIYRESYIQLQNTILEYIKSPQDNILKTSYGLDGNIRFSTISYGIYKVLKAESEFNNMIHTQYALLGGGGEINNAVYLKENLQPLYISGNAKVIGNVKLPKNGVKAGFVNGNYYNSHNLIYGGIGFSNKLLPSILNKSTFYNIFKDLPNSEYLNINTIANHTNSFSNEAQHIKTLKELTLKGITLSGNIIIKSTQRIIIEKTAHLNDVILIAPEIEVKEGTKGNFQMFSTKSISIAKNCELNYPSALVLLDESSESKIKIDKNVKFKGVILYSTKKNKSNHKINVHIPVETKIFGEVYCEGNLQLEGTVCGSVTTESFIYKDFSSTHINMLYNGKINNLDLPQEYAGFVYGDTYKVAKWLY